MPIVGVIDPSHTERRADAAGRYPRWLTPDALLAQAAVEGPGWSDWTYETLNAALMEQQDRDYISTTMLTGGCARSKVIERREDYIIDVNALYASVKGTQIHRALENSARPGSLAEARFFTAVHITGYGDVEVSCSPDLVTVNPTTIADYKVVGTQPQLQHPYHGHSEQLFLNRYIVNHAERWELPMETDLPFDPRTLEFQHLYIVYLGPKWPSIVEVKRSEKVTYKTSGREGNRWSPYIQPDADVEEWFIPRLKGMLMALDAYPEWPPFLSAAPGFEGPEGWACPGKPLCSLPDCLAKRWPNGLKWDSAPKKVRKA